MGNVSRGQRVNCPDRGQKQFQLFCFAFWQPLGDLILIPGKQAKVLSLDCAESSQMAFRTPFKAGQTRRSILFSL